MQIRTLLLMCCVVGVIGCEKAPAPASSASPTAVASRGEALSAVSSVPDDDAGDAAFVHQIVPTLIGRRIKNGLEFHVLNMIVDQHGREALVDVLTESDEFIEYWSQLFSDALLVKRRSPAGGIQAGKAQDPACYGPTSLENDEDLEALATHIISNDATSAFTHDFIMSDVIRGALRIDDLRAIYRSYIYPMMAFEMRATATTSLRKADAGQAFMKVYLNREVDCLECHSSTYSPTDAWSGVDRFAPVAVDLEGSLFGVAGAYGGQVGSGEAQQIYDIFDPSVLKTTDDSGAGPWGMNAACVSNGNSSSSAYHTYGITLAAGTASTGSSGFARLPTTAGVHDLGAQFMAGASALSLPLSTSAFTMAPEVVVYPGVCGWCHTGSDPPAHSALIPTRSNGRIFKAVFEGYGEMDALGVTAGEAWAFVEEARLAYPYDGDYPEVADDADAALAYGVAVNATSDILAALTGSPFTIEHGFPRTTDQQAIIEELTATLVAGGEWSLQAVIKGWVLSKMFNRRAPSDHVLSKVTATAYDLPPVFNPWVLGDEAETGGEHNSVGDLVHRWPVPNLFASAAHALGWPKPYFIGDQTVYPNARSSALVGRYDSEDSPGFGDVTFQALLAWEWAGWEECNACSGGDYPELTAYYGNRPRWIEANSVPGWHGDSGATSCAKDEAASSRYTYAAPNCWNDWIDVLAEGEVSGTTTLRHMVEAVRDRILGDPAVAPSGNEEAALIAFFDDGTSGITGLDDPWSDVKSLLTNQGATRRLRQYAHTLMMTPQFMLASLPTVTKLPPLLDATNWDFTSGSAYACFTGEPCDLASHVSAYDTVLGTLGLDSLLPDLIPDWDLALIGSPPVLTLAYGVSNSGKDTTTATGLRLTLFSVTTLTPAIGALDYGQRQGATTTAPPLCAWFEVVADNNEDLTEADETNNRLLGMVGGGTCLPNFYADLFDDLKTWYTAQLDLPEEPSRVVLSYADYLTADELDDFAAFNSWLTAKIGSGAPDDFELALGEVDSSQWSLIFLPNRVLFKAGPRPLYVHNGPPAPPE